MKKCACGQTFTASQWRALPFVGVTDDKVEPLELRNCSCGSTIALARCHVTGCEKLAMAKTYWQKEKSICRMHYSRFQEIKTAKLPGAAGQQARNNIIKRKFHKKWGSQRKGKGASLDGPSTNRKVPAKPMLEYLERNLK